MDEKNEMWPCSFVLQSAIGERCWNGFWNQRSVCRKGELQNACKAWTAKKMQSMRWRSLSGCTQTAI